VSDQPPHKVIKVTTTDEKHSYFVVFNRDGHDLIDVFEYKSIYNPAMGGMRRRIKEIVDTARTKLVPPAEATSGEKQ
jgi:hypothetical protein